MIKRKPQQRTVDSLNKKCNLRAIGRTHTREKQLAVARTVKQRVASDKFDIATKKSMMTAHANLEITAFVSRGLWMTPKIK